MDFMLRWFLVLGAVGILASSPARAGRDEAITQLLAQLGSDHFQEREAASRQLEALEASALPSLRKAREHPDLEVRRHVVELVQRLERRVDSRRLLEPKRLRLVVKNLPVPAAVAELARLTGASIQIHGNQAHLRQRRISLDTGETTFWDALTRLCQEAGLREVPTRPLVLSSSPEEERRAERLVVLNTSVFAQSPGSDGPFLLEEGPLPVLASTQVGALSIRALPPDGSSPLFPGPDRWLPLTLEVKPEPSIDWQSLVTLRIDRAIDEHGQLLQPSNAFVAGAYRPPLFDNRAMLFLDGELDIPVNAGLRQVSVALRHGTLPARRLRELHGFLAARIRPPVEPLVSAANILQAEGKTFPGPEGTALKVSSVKEADAGAYELKVEVLEAPRVLDFELPSVRIVNLNRREGQGLQLLTDAEKTSLFTLLDAADKPLVLATGSRGVNKDGSIKLYNLVFQAARAQGPPVRLLYNERRTALIEVPFILKDVPVR